MISDSKLRSKWMKHFNVNLAQAFVFFLIIWGTQTLIHADKSVSFEQHVQVQQELSELIATYVATHLPEMNNFKMYSVYTKAPRKGLMDAHFMYSFDTPVAATGQIATTALAGVATLRKIQERPHLEWALEKIQIEGETLTFSEPMVITSNGDIPEVKPTQPVAPAPVAPPVPPTPAPTNNSEQAPPVEPQTVAPQESSTTESPTEVNQ